jgi:hypothetical protein
MIFHFFFFFFLFPLPFRPQSAEMMNFFLTPCESSNNTTIQTKIPQNVVSDKETFNDRTRKSLLKINLFIKRLKYIFTATTTATAAEASTNNQQTNKALRGASERSEETQHEQQKWYNEMRMNENKRERGKLKLLSMNMVLCNILRNEWQKYKLNG